jgi:hypothetical protein
MESFFESTSFTFIYLIAVFAAVAVSIWFRLKFHVIRQAKIPFWALFPSMIYDAGDMQKILRWSTRLYYIYSILLNLAIQAVIHFDIEMNLGYFAFPIMIQAALLLHTFQTYRRFFALSPAVRNNFLLRLGFFFWLLFILLLGIEQIVRFPLFFGGLMMVLTNNENFASSDSSAYSWFINIFSLALGIFGELLLKKIIPKDF